MADDGSEDKTLESKFEPNNAEILTQLESGTKTYSELIKNLDMTTEKIDQSLSYLTQNGFVSKIEKNEQIWYSVEAEKLSQVLENTDNFKNVDDGLAKLDSFLN